MTSSIRSIDLNLLVALDALLDERNVTRAAERILISQPAMSGVLGRLRKHFDDELLSRVGRGYVLTPRAEDLAPDVTAAEYEQLGEVTNTVHSVINNGVIVNLNGGSSWKVTGTSYLSKLAVAPGASVRGADGHSVSMTVDGVPTTIVPGNTYTGSIVVTVS